MKLWLLAVVLLSGTAQVFLLQYLQGMPMRDVAWGHADFAGYAAGDPPPGGALGLLLLRDRQGRHWLRAFATSTYPEHLRDERRSGQAMELHGLGWRQCAGARGDLCPFPSFLAMVERRAAKTVVAL